MPIDRKALVSRHDPWLRAPDPASPLSLGNGEFAFTADITGLQSFPPSEARGVEAPGAEGAVPLCTMAQWGWHSFPIAPGEVRSRSALRLQEFDTGGRKVGYMTDASGQEELFAALRVNPHRLNLARLGLVCTAPGQGWKDLQPADIGAAVQRLRLYEGLLESTFILGGAALTIRAVVHPKRDILAFSIESEGLRSGALALRLAFPYGSPEIDASDWNSPERHRTAIVEEGSERLLLERSLDGDSYYAAIRTGAGGKVRREGPHAFILCSATPVLDVSIEFSPRLPAGSLPSWEECRSASAAHWADFWEGGGAIELAESADPRALELERRVILSRYLTAIQCSGSLPPQ
ncbi:MAG: hypothetical protein Q8O15_03745, partial [Rectinemataceae bacterium]|nr:hypothetical protein [Rectinemataceae bacterium]